MRASLDQLLELEHELQERLRAEVVGREVQLRDGSGPLEVLNAEIENGALALRVWPSRWVGWGELAGLL